MDSTIQSSHLRWFKHPRQGFKVLKHQNKDLNVENRDLTIQNNDLWYYMAIKYGIKAPTPRSKHPK